MAEHGAGPGTDTTPGTEERAEQTHVRSVAARLFADLGYDATSTQMIADATGVDRGTVTDRYGGKRGLYVAVVEWAIQGWRLELASLRRTYTPDTNGVAQVMHAYVHYGMQHPELSKLLIHRWMMSDASDVTGLDEEIIGPATQETVDLIRSALGPDIDAEAALWTLVWTVHGYLQAGYLDVSGRRRPPSDPETLRRFRQHLHWLIQRLTYSPA
ncbi:TetR/AcrR family transcriptional regulator [Spirillospora sp. CA-255316]